MASCVEHGEWELKYLACPKCFKDGDVRQPIYPPDRDFVDSLAIKPIDAWTGQEKMRLHNIATRATQSARPEALRRDVPPEIFDSMAVYMELHIEKNEMIKPSMVADVLDALMRLIRKRWKAEAAESPLLRSQEKS